ncbi:ATP phosphoribosyltransferase regulatory subunit [Paenibacillus sp. MER 180]|uniref:ATP phosphoribosyltransferase regulatory subunit n=1 Tax=Paenibacillus sp. MER 180 TaxID=2939570 RepID=UPI00203E0A0C|nr:ATP phosphoribosyltransferase regulatory subunit [Paenibacillus sp. MER 180]MCM3293777.1 ATP phosphoribosyltransferase regulatory subunit [Paenibacillus sp. MER 180]
MTKPRMFEKPSGVRDYLPEAVRRLRAVERKALCTMDSWGYAQIITPTMEYYETVGTASSTSDHKLFKLLNQRGTTMVLRSDMTAPIARVVASLLGKEPYPIRLSYHANVFRSMEEEAGREAEFYQTGAEMIGDGSPDADAEVIALSIACLEATGIERFKVALGHHGFLKGLLEYALPQQDEVQTQLKLRLVQRDVVGYRELIHNLPIDQEHRGCLEQVLHLRGVRDVLKSARGIADVPAMMESIHHLEKVWDVLEAYGVEDHIVLDLTMLGDFSYYTGTIFEGYAADTGFPVLNGGRYDNLLQQFGRSAPATGFALQTTRIVDVLSTSGDATDEDIATLTIQYDEFHRQEAFREAARLRKEGKKVVTQYIDSEGEKRLDGSVEPVVQPDACGNRGSKVLAFTNRA